MVRTFVTFGLLVGLLLGVSLLSPARADEKKPADKTQVVDAKKMPPITAPNFAKVFNLGLDTTDTLGYRLVTARKAHDPLALALIAVELRALEEASGKKAEVTSANVEKMAVELAKLRRESVELKAVAAIVKDVSAVKELKAAAEEAAKAEAEAADKAKSGEREKGARLLRVTNPIPDEGFWIWVDGKKVGFVPGGQTRVFNVAFTLGVPLFRVEAYGTAGDFRAGQTVQGDHIEFTWTIQN
jgi:hypothetical protein